MHGFKLFHFSSRRVARDDQVFSPQITFGLRTCELVRFIIVVEKGRLKKEVEVRSIFLCSV